MNNNNFKSGFVGLIGRTNVGKSTLVNKILNQKVVITSGKIQTTRNKINCILNTKNSQIIFVDCPGFFKPRSLLGERLNSIVLNVIDDSDLIVIIVDVADGIGKGDFFIFNKIKHKTQPKFLLLNKIDLVSKDRIEREKEKLQGLDFFDYTGEISAKTGENVDEFLTLLTDKLPEGPRYFENGFVTDQPVEKTISEVVREKLISNLSDEIPHSIGVEVERFEETTTRDGEKLIVIECNIYTERLSQKAIIIGKSGSMLKKVGRQARLELEGLLKSKVFLELWVKVEENWTKRESLLNRFGY
ncbi:MAG: GTPase Era [Actinobacteria bacterium RBG_13_35_12]|nr:MAG: GTPase Era [Actinobacteria bacterium RBG_13_35_12]